MGKCFFKVYLPSLSSKRLRIPVTFLTHMKGEISGRFSLMGPSGKVWNVNLTETPDGFFFEEGWSVFVRDHFIETGDFLVFKYDGNLHFTVHIYDPSECEKKSAFYAICSHDTTCSIRDKGKKREINKEEVKVLNDSSYKSCEGLSKRKRGMAANVANVSACELTSRKIKLEKNQLAVSSNCLAVSKTDNLEDSVYRNRRTLPCTLNKENKARKKAIAKRSRPLISQRRNVTKEETERAIKAAMAFESTNPYTVIVMCASHVYYRFLLCMPSSFRKSHLPKGNQELIMWDPSGRAWPVSYVVDNKRGALSGGWFALSHHNNIKADDVCIFELIKSNEMQLHIFRVVEEIRPLIKNSIEFKT